MWVDLSPISNTPTSRSIFYFGQPTQSSIRCIHNQTSGQILCLNCYNHQSCTSMSSLTNYNSGSIHIVANFNSILGSMSLFINSVAQYSSYLPYSLPNGDASDFVFLIGSSIVNTEESFQGSFDEFRIWSGLLSSLTISSHYENGPTSDYTNPTSELCKFFFFFYLFYYLIYYLIYFIFYCILFILL